MQYMGASAYLFLHDNCLHEGVLMDGSGPMVAKFVVFVREACVSEELQRAHLDIHILGSRSMMNTLGLQQQGLSSAFHQSVCIISQSLCLAKVALKAIQSQTALALGLCMMYGS